MILLGLGFFFVLFHHHPGYTDGYDPDCSICLTRGFLIKISPFIISSFLLLISTILLARHGMSGFYHGHSHHHKCHHHGPCIICLWQSFLHDSIRGDLRIILTGIIPVCIGYFVSSLVTNPGIEEIAPRPIRAPPAFSF
jgi:hypothetical protein